MARHVMLLMLLLTAVEARAALDGRRLAVVDGRLRDQQGREDHVARRERPGPGVST